MVDYRSRTMTTLNKMRIVMAGGGNVLEYRETFPDIPEPPVEGMRRERCLQTNHRLNQGISPETDPLQKLSRLSDTEVMDIRTRYGKEWVYGLTQQGEIGRIWWKDTRNNTYWKYPHTEPPCEPINGVFACRRNEEASSATPDIATLWTR